MNDYESTDFFTDQSLVPDPYPYFDHLRSKCPVLDQPHQGVLAVTGHQEALAVYKDAAFSACVSVAGPFSGLPFKPAGEDIGELIEQYRDRIPMSEHIVTQDPPLHTRTRGQPTQRHETKHGGACALRQRGNRDADPQRRSRGMRSPTRIRDGGIAAANPRSGGFSGPRLDCRTWVSCTEIGRNLYIIPTVGI